MCSEEIWEEDGGWSKGCNFQPEIEAAILSNLKNSIKGNPLVSWKERASFRMLLVMLPGADGVSRWFPSAEPRSHYRGTPPPSLPLHAFKQEHS